MPSQEEIFQQQELLAAYRRMLAHLLQQAAQYGGTAFAPPATANGIREAHQSIRRTKGILRDYGISIADMPNDEPGESATITGDRSITGNQSNINTGGGDYAGRDIDKRQGVFVIGGTIHGSVVGINSGNITIDTMPLLLDKVVTQIEQTVTQARQRGDDDLADDLQGVILPLQAAIKAQSEGKEDRRMSKLTEARESLRKITNNQPDLRELAHMLDRAS
jgi:hypothetical protein